MLKNLSFGAIKSTGAIVAKVAIVASASIGGAALVSSSVFASLTAVASNTSGGSVTTGTLSLTQAPSVVSGMTGGFTTAITAMAPGDVIKRYVVLTNGGTLDASAMTLALSASPSTALTTNGTAGLQIAINKCSVAWTATGVCSGTTTAALASTSALTLASAQTFSPTALTAGAISHLQIVITLPTGSEVTTNGTFPGGTVQGLTTALTWTFTETQRTATTTEG